MSIQWKPAFDHSGSSFDSFLEEEGILDEVDAVAIQRVAAWQEERASTGRTSLRPLRTAPSN